MSAQTVKLALMFTSPWITKKLPFIRSDSDKFTTRLNKFTRDFVRSRRLENKPEVNDFADVFIGKIRETTEKNDVQSAFYGERGCKIKIFLLYLKTFILVSYIY